MYVSLLAYLTQTFIANGSFNYLQPVQPVHLELGVWRLAHVFWSMSHPHVIMLMEAASANRVTLGNSVKKVLRT